ncbi:PREDICTED: E3 ubiquitin-protein ligase SDIR1-like isoform X1 [Lupinus angustifolius]|uniref:E3 ubiquitin-protein ligase SDIR1-like isoform X1 n=1 Tax=Lupinus angustifolius TaxID=3871 RepID=UPI00092EB792|nr:PREDICTED: E3 ubiquitin-protein ligase SDIR1-like isoform X1 [Lupinus angustifolius]XP_019447961.1 PREDICTED: E3 ubiquitin-protein ligase SDIR1-like isoform X1 [Lupinus angustifolius]XP_019447962.1 PREDICTED: E3 ubiquitin-protein ligase SDIR1-like isoform X1 [Lupinus angustifolius]XP_019447963.1 PREDICTED: E3 ubiquitin-protein ligase SDIR1-like isoform X1 [Lupinus angustifolius]XP_019447964.1 PREDICTED: E3 ubiquitin-protein ligase SDIR1-like isoform X1 [Lupinus angustifolius]XP_019447965.1 
MSFVFRGSRGDIESGFSEYVPERTTMRVHSARPHSNSLALLIIVLCLFMILNSPQATHYFLLWLVLAFFAMATSIRMYAVCQHLQAQARAHAAAATGLIGHTELRFHVPPSLAIATRGRLHGLRLQLALIDRDFDELDYDTLRSLDSNIASNIPSMTEEEINALPVHTYKVADPTKLNKTMKDQKRICMVQKMSLHVLYAWTKLTGGSLFVVCHACISFMPTALIHGSGNKEHVQCVNSGWGYWDCRETWIVSLMVLVQILCSTLQSSNIVVKWCH